MLRQQIIGDEHVAELVHLSLLFERLHVFHIRRYFIGWFLFEVLALVQYTLLKVFPECVLHLHAALKSLEASASPSFW